MSGGPTARGSRRYQGFWRVAALKVRLSVTDKDLVSCAGLIGLFGSFGLLGHFTRDEKEGGRVFRLFVGLCRIFHIIGTFAATVGVFLFGWYWAVDNWGWLLGIAFGWIPSLIVAIMAGAAWPLLLWLGCGGLMLWERFNR
jgi:hypothetical protein